jgi:uroporphyrinogen III methyltransferase/synthase
MCFTSVNAVDAIGKRLQALGLGWAALARTRLAAIGPATAQAVKGHGANVEYMPNRFLADAISAGLPDAEGARVLLARADIVDDRLVVALEARGARVDQFVAYRTIVSDENASDLRQLLERGAIDIVTFASSSTVRNLCSAIGESAARHLNRTVVACIGPVTAETARAMGVQPAVVSAEHTIPGLVRAIREHLAS